MTTRTVSTARCKNIAERLKRARAKTESSVLAIGTLLGEIVEAATEDLEAAKRRLGITSEDGEDQSSSVTQSIRAQSQLIHAFVNEMRSFIRRQIDFSDAANQAFDLITDCSSSVAKLMEDAFLLSLNLRIEAGRLGKLGSSVSTIGSEMMNFSNNVAEANTSIVKALDELKESLPRIRSEMAHMDVRSTRFSAELVSGLDEVEGHAGKLDQSLKQSLIQAEQKNKSILQLSLATLSELQFQDPVAQDLRKAEEEMRNLPEAISPLGQVGDQGMESCSPFHFDTDETSDEQFQTNGEVVLF